MIRAAAVLALMAGSALALRRFAASAMSLKQSAVAFPASGPAPSATPPRFTFSKTNP